MSVKNEVFSKYTKKNVCIYYLFILLFAKIIYLNVVKIETKSKLKNIQKQIYKTFTFN